MKNKQLLVLFLAASMLLSASCQSGSNDTPSSDDTTTNPPETEADVLDFLPEGLDYGGKEVSILYAQVVMNNLGEENEVTYSLDETGSGDIVIDAVYKRTKTVEEKLNVKIVSREEDCYDTLKTAIMENALSGSNDFQAVCGRLATMSGVVPEGYFYNLRDIDTLDLSNAWWDQAVNEGMLLNGKQYFMTGDINYYDDYAVIAMAFNKKLFEDYHLEEPYDMVREGTWDFEAFCSIVKNAQIDLNNDGKYDENDFYGFTADQRFGTSTLLGFGERVTTTADDGSIVFNQSESMISKAMTMAEQLLSEDAFLVKERKLGYALGDALFPNGQALMAQTLIGSIVSYRQQMTDDFGILPFPKYDEAQEDYISSVNPYWASVYAVSSSCQDTDMIGYVLDTMGALSTDTVVEAVIEKNVLVKSSRDEDSAEMLRLIFKSKILEPAIAYSSWGAEQIWNTITMWNDANGFVSYIAENAPAANQKIADMMEKLDALE
ncbi:MAG: hypothetical protein IJ493_05640 [Clostridia bacterium]|nr:hypothetical protein [Clostridia bacterium]